MNEVGENKDRTDSNSPKIGEDMNRSVKEMQV